MVCVRTGLSVYTGSTVRGTGGLCQDWSVSVMLIVQWLEVCVRTGLSVYADSTVAGGLCQDWSVSVYW